MGKEEVGWGEEYGDHKGRGCSRRKQRSGPRYRRGSRLRLLAPPRPPPSTSCSRAREGQRPERQQGEEGDYERQTGTEVEEEEGSLGEQKEVEIQC